MKASTLSDEHELNSRHERLDRALLQTHASERGVTDLLNRLTLASKEKIYFENLERERLDEYWRQYRDSLLNQRRHLDAGFPNFCQLPKELRLQIWEHAMEDDIQPRVHIVTKKSGQYVSNQGISVLLSTCSESRMAYIDSGAVVAFRTYVYFDTAIIYIRPFPNAQGLGPWWVAEDGALTRDALIFEEKAPLIEVARREREARRELDGFDSSDEEQEEREGMFWGTIRHDAYMAGALLTWDHLLNDASVKKIKHLAMTIDFFRTIPMSETPRESHDIMRKKLPLWEETMLVFDDMRQQTIAWKDTKALFRDSCAADKMRRNYLTGGVAKRIKLMTLSEEDRDGITPMVYRYVFVKHMEADEDRIPRNEQEIDARIEKLKAFRGEQRPPRS